MMLLDDGGIDSFEQVDELWASKKSPINVQKFADFLSDCNAEHKVIIECSGTMAQVMGRVPSRIATLGSFAISSAPAAVICLARHLPCPAPFMSSSIHFS